MLSKHPAVRTIFKSRAVGATCMSAAVLACLAAGGVFDAHASTLPLAIDGASAAGLGLACLGTTAAGGDKPAKTKFFRIAKEGATIDGRTIQRAWLTQAAANYDPVNVYGARLNLEHIKGMLPDGPFQAYGDVLALETRDEPDGKMGLYAQIKPLPELVAMNKRGQKIYTSCEFNLKFADSGEAYLVGLAVTDNPASLGTEMLTFAAQHPDANPLAKRKQAPDNVFTAATEELVIELEAQSAPAVLLSKIKTMLGRNGQASEARFADLNAAVEEVATHVQEAVTQLNANIASLNAGLAKLTGDLETVTTSLSTTRDQQTARPLATGGNGTQIKTDC